MSNNLFMLPRIIIICHEATSVEYSSLFCSQGNMDQFSMLLDHDADPSIGLARSGRNLLHMLATGCTEHDLRKYMKIVLKKV